MEAATLSGPHRKCTVVPVQKSLSLPSYARAGGEGIDHRLIFAALEQKERVRRKSRIFAPRKEKCERQTHLFCLPIPSSGAKCRETSLSSDTSCSSLEYQKTSPVLPKKGITAKTKKEDKTNPEKEHIAASKKEDNIKPVPKQGTPSYETATTIQSESKSNLNTSRMVRNGAGWDNNLDVNVSQKVINDHRKGPRSPVDTLKVNVGSSDSMDRSSRSSSDSLSRKERMVALKARVEAAREKYGSTSSEDEETESRSLMTRYNSDGVIHRSVREIKSRSYLREKRLRRRSQDEFSIKKNHRKQNLSLSLSPEGDGIKLNLEKASSMQNSVNHFDIKTDFCPSPNYPEILKKNYFSDFPSKENAAHFVQARIRHIEDEERKRRSGSDFRDKFGILNLDNMSPASTEHRRPVEKLSGSSSTLSEKKPPSLDLALRSSPIPRSSQAPTPPPRSPKSMTFVNKAFIQHQNSYLLNQDSSLERKKILLSNIPAVSYSQIFDKSDSRGELNFADSKVTASASPNATSEKQKMRELIGIRRKTCGNFDFIDNDILNDLCSMSGSFDSTTSNLISNKKFSSVMQIKKTDSKGYFSGSETPCMPSEEDIRSKLWKSKWQENEQRKEYMFNSLESRKKSPSWLKCPPDTEACLCRLFPDNKLSCPCKSKLMGSKQIYQSTTDNSTLKNFNSANAKNISSIQIQYPSNRLSKSDFHNDTGLEMKRNQLFKNVSQACENISNGDSHLSSENTEKLSAAANLDNAMEELENIYRSLKMSSDNLSDRNSISNVSLSDDEVKFPKPKNKDLGITDSRFQRRSSVCETGLGSSKSPLLNYSKSPVFHPLKNMLPLEKDITSEMNQFAIDELFNDLTQQLDFEQKRLKEPRDNRNQQSKYPLQVNRLDTPKRLNKAIPQVSLHKEFYENLCKANRDQNIKNNSITVSENGTSGPRESIEKKKYKAVRSLSENISYLMSTANMEKPVNKKTTNSNNIKTLTEQASPKYLERILDTSESKRDMNFKQSNLSPKSNETALNSKCDEIRHIRVSMDTNVYQPKPSSPSNTFSNTKQFPSLSSAVSSMQPSPNQKPATTTEPPTNVTEVTNRCLQEQNLESKENLDVLDETGLEKLLNSLLGEVPERQSSPYQSKDCAPATPPPVAPGKLQNVTASRNITPLKMDVYVTPKVKAKSPSAECRLRSIKSEENAQRVNFRQNNNALLNQTSFIPVYTKKTDMCHNFPKSATEDKSKSSSVESGEPVKTINTLHSPPPRQKCLPDQTPGRAWNSHVRRRSVGFEDVASLSSNYGYNLSNSKRIQTETVNSNITAELALRPNNSLNSENDKNFSYGKEKVSDCEFISATNQNSQVTENENDGFVQGNKSSQPLKDKSSKRKSSLNRMDFLDFSLSCSGNIGQQKASQLKNSSSDDGSDPPKSEFLSSKRKHYVSSSQSLSKEANKQLNEVPLQSSSRGSKGGTHLLPRTLHSNHLKSKYHRRVHSAATHLQKFSHSAGELESLTDLSETAGPSNKICLSAQELDPSESLGKHSKHGPPKKFLYVLPVKSPPFNDASRNSNGNASHSNVQPILSENNSNSLEMSSKVKSLVTDDGSNVESSTAENQTLKDGMADENKPVLSSLERNGALDLKHIDSRSEDDVEIIESTVSMKNLDISNEISFDNEIYISADDNCDPPESDPERRPSSILRKKISEERKELHGILKPSSDEKQSKTPPSILKHRESSEEKDVWQQGDLHSILKKSTSEDESYNSGPDIRPILKVSTDDESPSCSMMRPRPILKKRTSFSEECSYASYPNGELKPILKKKSPLASDDQPRPILKSRRKSEDVRSTMFEFIASRPRAYSADMGVKPNLENRFDPSESNKEDPSKPEQNDL
ncbi:uncharacterized protein NPIL_385551 [Nephila pilipes]|uniref:Uncharacterized protein n=1 Tax=Nephila pilipes TaxID=299642 RepID=A0A8X6PFE1_NEPPI|nr:uncharacterized protein NPIL_385551 [Nephila pilipes]